MLKKSSKLPRDPFQYWHWPAVASERKNGLDCICSKNHFLFPFNFIFYLLVFCRLFVQPHLADVVWTELHMLVCWTETLDRRILPKKVKVVLEKKQRNTVEYCQKVKGNDRHDTTLPSSTIKQNLFFAWKD